MPVHPPAPVPQRPRPSAVNRYVPSRPQGLTAANSAATAFEAAAAVEMEAAEAAAPREAAGHRRQPLCQASVRRPQGDFGAGLLRPSARFGRLPGLTLQPGHCCSREAAAAWGSCRCRGRLPLTGAQCPPRCCHSTWALHVGGATTAACWNLRHAFSCSLRHPRWLPATVRVQQHARKLLQTGWPQAAAFAACRRLSPALQHGLIMQKPKLSLIQLPFRSFVVVAWSVSAHSPGLDV